MGRRFAHVLRRFGPEIAAGYGFVHGANSNIALQTFPDSCFDWVYIDGNHLYELVRGDLEPSQAKVKPGGCITGDDYAEGGWWKGGVKKAVDAFVASQPVTVLALEHRQFVLRNDTR